MSEHAERLRGLRVRAGALELVNVARIRCSDEPPPGVGMDEHLDRFEALLVRYEREMARVLSEHELESQEGVEEGAFLTGGNAE